MSEDCPICYNQFYSIPLPCNHSACSTCLTELLGKEGAKCPLCRKDLLDVDTLLNNCEDSKILCYLGFLYHNGCRFICKDQSKGIEFYIKSAKAGNQYAQCMLGKIYIHGMGVKSDVKKAVKYTRMSAEQGNIMAQTNMVYFYVHGFDQETISLEEMWKWQNASCDKNIFAKVNMGIIYYYGYGVPQDKEKAKEILITLEDETGDSNYHLALIYEEEGSYDQAFQKYYKIYSNRYVHHRDASGKLGYCYHFGLGCMKMESCALQYYFLDRYNPVTQYYLGIYYEEKDPEKSILWYRKSAKNGYAPAIYNLALSETNERKKIKLLKKLDDPDAYCNLANIYLQKGKVKKAVKLYKKSAKQKNVYACYNLSLLYRNGWGVKKNYKKALKYMDMSLKIDL